MEWTSDQGRTWSRTEALNDGEKVHAIQPTILVHRDGRLQILCRSRRVRNDPLGHLVRPRQDVGRASALGAPNPNSGIDAVTLEDGRHLLVYNHTAAGRSPLNVALSSDGEAWSAALVLEDQPGEYSYPAVIQAPDGLVHITYTWNRKRIRHVVVDPAKLAAQPIGGGGLRRPGAAKEGHHEPEDVAPELSGRGGGRCRRLACRERSCRPRVASSGPTVFAAGADKPARLGGPPVRSAPFPSWPVFDEREEKALVEVLHSGKWYRGNGQTVSRFEEAYARLTGARHCIATANGTSALFASLAALDVGPGDEVILSTYTFIATLNVVFLQHALPIFVDTDPETLQIDRPEDRGSDH